MLVASLLTSFAFAVWPLSADAKGNNGSHVSTHEITITKKVDKSSPMMSNKKAARIRDQAKVLISITVGRNRFTNNNSPRQSAGPRPRHPRFDA